MMLGRPVPAEDLIEEIPEPKGVNTVPKPEDMSENDELEKSVAETEAAGWSVSTQV